MVSAQEAKILFQKKKEVPASVMLAEIEERIFKAVKAGKSFVEVLPHDGYTLENEQAVRAVKSELRAKGYRLFEKRLTEGRDLIVSWGDEDAPGFSFYESEVRSSSAIHGVLRLVLKAVLFAAIIAGFVAFALKDLAWLQIFAEQRNSIDVFSKTFFAVFFWVVVFGIFGAFNFSATAVARKVEVVPLQ